MKKIISFLLLLSCDISFGQFAPPAGQAGTTAMHKDSSAFVNWASACTITRGYQDISDPGSGYASVGDSSMALGIAGSNGVVSLGDGGAAILQFQFPITDGPGFDFAIFENSFSDDYLELAFVEVSSDGINYTRFPATSNTQDTTQVGPFDLLDATRLNNLAGKYRMLYGTPFDLSELTGTSGLDITNITHLKIIDVVGSVQPAYASLDQNANKINDPWPTAFPSSGFDLDAVGVIHENSQIGFAETENARERYFICYSQDNVLLNYKGDRSGKLRCALTDLSGRELSYHESAYNRGEFYNFNFSSTLLQAGIYFVSVQLGEGKKLTEKILIR
jgi:hypothetical protein